MAGTAPPLTTPWVLTRSYDVGRSGTNLDETTLTPAVITGGKFGKLFCRAVDDEIYGQILYVTGLDLGAAGRKNVAFVVTMNDSVYAFDADGGTTDPLWQKSFLGSGATPVPTSDLNGQICYNYRDISHAVGITSTPVIDPATRTIYVVARTKESGSFVQRLHALDLRDGSERTGSPVSIDASVSGSGSGASNGTIKFDPQRNNQRAALTLAGGAVYIGFASHCDWEPYHGWLLAYDAQSLAQLAVYNVTPNGRNGGIWMSGSGPAVDDAGNLYLVTGNGTADLSASGPDRGEAFIKLQRSGSTFTLVDWFTPADYQNIENEDRDLGSSGAVLVPGTNIVLGGNKEGILYLLDRTDFGHFNSTDNSQIIQTMSVTGSRRSHIHGNPVAWKSSAGHYLYVMGEEDYLKQYQLNGNQLALYKTSQIRAPIVPNPVSGYTMPGGILALTAAGDQAGTGLLWVTIPVSQDANQAVVPGVLRVFDAADVTSELWNSEQNGSRDSYGNFAKFNPPTVVNGKVYVPTFSNQFCVYGKMN
jgi:hypothetical protein